MSTPFFGSAASLTALSTSAAKWPGTPFAHYGAVAGAKGGASCHCLAQAVLAGAGFTTETLPRVRVTYGRQHTGGLMLPWFRARGSLFQEIKPPAAAAVKPGDVIVANLHELSENHCGVALPGGVVIHTLGKTGAHVTALGDPFFHSCIVGVFRPLAQHVDNDALPKPATT